MAMQRIPASTSVGSQQQDQSYKAEYTKTHKKITEPNFIIFEFFSVIPALWLPNRFVSGINGSR